MRSLRLLTPLALLIPLAAPAAASAADVEVVNFAFTPKTVQIQPGDQVTWTFSDTVQHTTTSVPDEWERWNGTGSGGGTYSREFSEPGRYDYLCMPHPSMKGEVQVGSDAVGTTIKSAKAKVRGATVRLTVVLNEDAAITWAKLKGPSKKRKLERRYEGERASRTLRGLDPGRYRAKIRAVDRFDDASSRTVRFRIRG
jgi:plastocyanin